MTLFNKNVLVTGASGGLGASIAKSFSSRNCNLMLVGQNLEKLENLQKQLREANTKNDVSVAVCNLENSKDIRFLAKHVEETFGQIDILVNCAGVFQISSIDDTTLEEYEKCIKVNLTAPFLLTQCFLKGMKDKKWGRIINIASSSAYGAAPGTSVYSASKHGMLGLSRALYKELKSFGIRVLCVSPGTIKTDMGHEVTKLGQDYATFMDPAEVAEYVVYNTEFDGNLVSEEIRLNRVHVQ